MLASLANRHVNVLRLALVALAVLGIAVTSTASWAQPARIEVVPRIGHSTISAIVFSPDGRIIVTGSDDRTVKLWDAKSGRLLRTLAPNAGDAHDRDSFATEGNTQVGAVAYSPDGRTIASGHEDGSLRFWDAASGRVLRTIQAHPKGYVRAVVYSPDGRTLVSGSWDKTAKVWDVATGSLRRTLTGHKDYVETVAFSKEGRRIATSGQDGMVKLWDAASGRELRTITAADRTKTGRCSDTSNLDQYILGIPEVAFSPDGRKIVSRCDSGPLRLWDTETGRQLGTIAGSFDTVAFLPDGRIIANQNDLKLFDAATGKELGKISSGTLNIAAVSPDGHTVAGGLGPLQAWSIDTGQELFPPSESVQFVNAVTISPDGQTIVSAGNDHTLKFWDAASGRERRIISVEGAFFKTVVFSPDGRIVAADGKNGNVTLWDAEGGRELRTLKTFGLSTDALAFSPDGHLLSGGSAKNSLTLWDAASGNKLNGYPNNRAINAAAFSPDGRTFASAEQEDKTFTIRDVSSGRELRKVATNLYYCRALAFSPDGRTIVSAGSERTLTVWDATSGLQLHALTGHSGDIQSAAFSPDGRTIVSASRDNTMRIWDVATARALRTLTGHGGEVSSVAFSPDGRSIVSGSEDSTVRRWSIDGTLLATSIGSATGEWVTITPEGFFVASDKGANILSVVRGLEAFSINQFYQALYRPDLVREKLAGDPSGLVREAAARLDLNAVLASGNAPAVAIVPLTGGSAQVTAAVDVTNTGGGIGRVEWRLNGVTIGVETPATPATGAAIRLTRGLPLDAGDNVLEVVAYNGQNLVASLPVRVTVAGPAQAAPTTAARLFVLAVGLNEYADPNIRLNLAVPDAEALSEALAQAGKGLYSSVEVTLLRDAEVTRERLDATFSALAGKVQPTDTFVFFLAGHGKTIDGRYYFMPQTTTLDSVRAITSNGGADTRQKADAELRNVVLAQGIAQEQWQTWFASIPARHSVLLFDTCESGSLTEEGRDTRALERDAANGRLAQATGRTILTAASDDQQAHEGYRGHGLFTYNVLEALERGDSDRDGKIDVTELAAYVYAEVSALSEQVFRAQQVPQVRIAGNFPLVNQAAVLNGADPGLSIAAKPTHVLRSASELLIQPALGATSVRKLDANTPVTLVKSEGGWTLVAREGRPIGYVASGGLAPMQ